MLSDFNYGSPVLKAIINRRTTLHYSDHQVSKSAIETLLEAGMRISQKSGDGLWSYAVIQDGCYIEYLKEYSALLEKMDAAYLSVDAKRQDELTRTKDSGASSLILVCANLALLFSLDDCWLAVENILLTGSALGFGVSMDGSMLKVLNISNIKSDLNVPEELTILAAIFVGEPEKSILPPKSLSPKVWKWMLTNQ